MPSQTPERLWLVRHGESVANAVRLAAHATDALEIDLEHRDVDVPLSALGARQATALGTWFSERPADERPDVLIASPYTRARQTAEGIAAAGGTAFGDAFDPSSIVVDERVREKELGSFYRLTRRGIEVRHPEQWALRRQLGRFWFRAPGGESWADVAPRLRAALDAISRDHAGRRVMVVCHQVVVLCARYVLERMTEQEVVAVARAHDVANCSVTSYRASPHDDSAHGDRPSGLALDLFNYTVPLREEGAPVTAEPNVSAQVA